jgi:hypothetical protein
MGHTGSWVYIDTTGVVMIILFLAVLAASEFGLLLGALVSVRFIRQEVSAELGPKLRQIQGQLDSMEAELNYAVSSRYAELNAQLSPDQRRQAA